jgi:hypothetical protein
MLVLLFVVFVLLGGVVGRKGLGRLDLRLGGFGCGIPGVGDLVCSVDRCFGNRGRRLEDFCSFAW